MCRCRAVLTSHFRCVDVKTRWASNASDVYMSTWRAPDIAYRQKCEHGSAHGEADGIHDRWNGHSVTRLGSSLARWLWRQRGGHRWPSWNAAPSTSASAQCSSSSASSCCAPSASACCCRTRRRARGSPPPAPSPTPRSSRRSARAAGTSPTRAGAPRSTRVSRCSCTTTCLAPTTAPRRRRCSFGRGATPSIRTWVHRVWGTYIIASQGLLRCATVPLADRLRKHWEWPIKLQQLTSPVAIAPALETAQMPAPVWGRMHDWWESEYNYPFASWISHHGWLNIFILWSPDLARLNYIQWAS